MNLSGRAFMTPLDCPFRKADEIIRELKSRCDIIILDFHAEATSEKQAMGFYLDGRVNAVIGTHTHTQTADARLLPKGTAYITDVGMVGALDSVLGVKVDCILDKFLYALPVKWRRGDACSTPSCSRSMKPATKPSASNEFTLSTIDRSVISVRAESIPQRAFEARGID